MELGFPRCPEDLILQLAQRLLGLMEDRVKARDEVVEDDQKAERGVGRDLVAEGAVHAVDAIHRVARAGADGQKPGVREEDVHLDRPTGRSRGERRYPNLLRPELEPGPLSEARQPGAGRLVEAEGGRHESQLLRRGVRDVEPGEATCRQVSWEIGDRDLRCPRPRVKDSGDHGRIPKTLARCNRRRSTRTLVGPLVGATLVREYAVSTMLEGGQPYSCAHFDD